MSEGEAFVQFMDVLKPWAKQESKHQDVEYVDKSM